MKYLIIILFACLTNIALGFHGSHHSSHSSSHHSTSHSSYHSSSHSTGHTSSHSYHISHGTSHSTGSHATSHPYSHISSVPKSSIHTTTRNNHFMYYYLLHNNHSNSHDTVFASNEYELNQAVNEVSADPNESSEISPFAITIICVVIVGVIYMALKHL